MQSTQLNIKTANQSISCWAGRQSALAGLLLFHVAFVGCKHSEKGFVTGTLLHKDGKPLAGARVIARPTNSGKAAYGTADANGYFELGGEQKGDGIAPGEYQLSITEDPGVDSDHRSPPTIAPKYNNATSSG